MPLGYPLPVLERRTNEIARQIVNRSGELIQVTSKAILRSVAAGTPVDKGVARSNYRVTFAQPSKAGVRRAFAPGNKLGIGETANLNAVVAEGEARLDQIQTFGRPGGGERRTKVYITNTAPHTVKLNVGSSMQAPAGFVQASIVVGLAVIKSFRLLKPGQGFRVR